MTMTFSLRARSPRRSAWVSSFSSYLDRIYRELGRVHKGRVRENLEFFERAIEPHFGLDRSRATTGFRLLANLWLVLVTAETARGVIVFVPGTWDALVQALVYVLVEVLLLSQFIPDFLLARTRGRWLVTAWPSSSARFCGSFGPSAFSSSWPASIARISDEQHGATDRCSRSTAEGIEALVVDAAGAGGNPRCRAKPT